MLAISGPFARLRREPDPRRDRTPLCSRSVGVMRVAAMDLGSNSFHLLVADVHADGHIDPLVQEKEMLRLGDVVSRHGVDPAHRGRPGGRHRPPLPAARRGRRRHRDPGQGHRARSAAPPTAARSSTASDAETGVHVDVIGGLEEARLIFGAVRASVVLDPSPALCFDLGGGSLEVMVGDASGLHVGHERAPRRGAPQRRASCTPTRSPSATGARCATTSRRCSRRSCVDVGELRAQARGRAAAARSSRWPRWSRRGATRTRPRR